MLSLIKRYDITSGSAGCRYRNLIHKQHNARINNVNTLLRIRIKSSNQFNFFFKRLFEFLELSVIVTIVKVTTKLFV